MKIYEEKSIRDFDFWSGATDRICDLTDDDWDIIESQLEAEYPDGMSDVELNDLFWFDFDYIVGMLGYEDEADFDRKRSDGYLDDDALEEYVADWFRELIEKVGKESGTEGLEELASIFGYDTSEAVEEYRDAESLDEDDEVDPKEALLYILDSQADDESGLFSTLFDDDNGHDCSDYIPTKEDFRDEMIFEHKEIK